MKIQFLNKETNMFNQPTLDYSKSPSGSKITPLRIVIFIGIVLAIGTVGFLLFNRSDRTNQDTVVEQKKDIEKDAKELAASLSNVEEFGYAKLPIYYPDKWETETTQDTQNNREQIKIQSATKQAIVFVSLPKAEPTEETIFEQERLESIYSSIVSLDAETLDNAKISKSEHISLPFSKDDSQWYSQEITFEDEGATKQKLYIFPLSGNSPPLSIEAVYELSLGSNVKELINAIGL